MMSKIFTSIDEVIRDSAEPFNEEIHSLINGIKE